MKRNVSVDIAKGVAICLMVIGHCYSSENIVLTLIYAFHMPFFFIISGVLYADKWKNNISIRPLSLIKRLLIPYIIFEILFSVYLSVLGKSHNILADVLNKLLYVIIPMIGVTVTWFLPCQLIVTISSFAIVKLNAKFKFISIISFPILFFIALLIPVSNGYVTVIWRAFIGIGFFAIGYLGRNIFVKQTNLLIVLASFIVFIVTSNLNGMVSLVGLKFNNVLLYVLNGILGSYVLYQICLNLKVNKFTNYLCWLGKNTIIVLCTHMFVIEIIRIIDYKLFNNVLNQFGLFEGLIFGAIVISIESIIVIICNKYFWWMFGEKRS